MFSTGATSGELLNHGYFTYQYSTDPLNHPSLEVTRLLRKRNDKEDNGFGTAAIRKVVEESLLLDSKGHVHVNATDGHIFYLYMGFIPIDREEKMVKKDRGFEGRRAVEEYSKLKEKLQTKTPLAEEKENLSCLKHLLSNIMRINKKEITDQMIIGK